MQILVHRNLAALIHRHARLLNRNVVCVRASARCHEQSFGAVLPLASRDVNGSDNLRAVLSHGFGGRVGDNRNPFLREEFADKPGGFPVVVISDRLWRTRFNSDPQIAGKTVRLNRREMTIVGVTPPEFHGTLSGLSTWIFEDTAFQKAFLWASLFEVGGFGCMSGPLGLKIWPPFTAGLHFIRPGTTKLPPFPGLPVLGGMTRSWLDVSSRQAVLSSPSIMAAGTITGI